MMAELFAYPVVLNGIVLTGSTQETVFAVYMIYRAFAGRGRHDASAGADCCERQCDMFIPIHKDQVELN
jgi:hypothetical protein